MNNQQLTHRSYDPFIYWEARAPYWIKEIAHRRDSQWRKEIKKYVKPEWKVLDLGCGTGRWSSLFPHYIGADVSPTLLEHAKKLHHGKQFAHHDMRNDVEGDFDLIFTFTAWLHLNPKDIKKVKLPDCRYLFVEPHGESTSEHCFTHDYGKLFGCRKIITIDKLTMWGKGL